MDSSAAGSSTSKSSRTITAILLSFFVAIIALLLVSQSVVSPYYNLLILPTITYILTVCASSILQYVNCNKVDIGTILAGNSIVLLTNFAATLFLFVESIPFLKYTFGPYDPRNPISGLPYDHASPEYAMSMENENHYKIQLFSNIVKGVLPVYLDEELKKGIVHMYWIFWMTLLPSYFLFSVQSACSA